MTMTREEQVGLLTAASIITVAGSALSDAHCVCSVTLEQQLTLLGDALRHLITALEATDLYDLEVLDEARDSAVTTVEKALVNGEAEEIFQRLEDEDAETEYTLISPDDIPDEVKAALRKMIFGEED